MRVALLEAIPFLDAARHEGGQVTRARAGELGENSSPRGKTCLLQATHSELRGSRPLQQGPKPQPVRDHGVPARG